MTQTDPLLHELSAQLTKKCEQHHLVVWDDPESSYQDVVQAACPDGWHLESFDGSWWELRQRVEPFFSGATEPRLLVYLAATPPAADPLEELRRSAGSFRRLLPTLLEQALGASQPSARIHELAERCDTLSAAQVALANSSGLDPQLAAAFNVRTETALVVSLLTAESTSEFPTDTWVSIGELVEEHLGVSGVTSSTPSRDSLRQSIAVHLIVADLAGRLGDDIEEFRSDWLPITQQQRRHVSDVLEQLTRPATLEAWGTCSDLAASTLSLAKLGWRPELSGCFVARALDECAFAEAARIAKDAPEAALELATMRVTGSHWLLWRDSWANRLRAEFDAAAGISRLWRALDQHPVPRPPKLEDLYIWYSNGGWRVDRCHRLMETGRYGLSRPGLDEAFTAVREAYLVWIDQVLVATAAVASDVADLDGLSRQARIFSDHVLSSTTKTALIIVDALRLEAGHRLQELVQPQSQRSSLEATVAAVPSITSVGMANLLPGAADGLSVQVVDNKLVVSAGGKRISTVTDRTSQYKSAMGNVDDDTLSGWMSLGDDVLHERASAADLLIIRSQEIDAAGEAGLAAVRWSQIDAVLEALAVMIARLSAAGVERVLVTADHGFIALGRPLDSARTVTPPTGKGITLHGRAWLGEPTAVPDTSVRVAIDAFGVATGQAMVTPVGLATYVGNGGASFFHGGVSPQEVLIPLLEFDLTDPQGVSIDTAVAITVPGQRISAEAFSATLTLGGSLFASDTDVRITAVNGAGDTVARMVSGEGVDQQSGTVSLDPYSERILTFIVSHPLDRNEVVRLDVLAASTGRRLAQCEATVARDLRPEEDW